jgi:serpin B
MLTPHQQRARQYTVAAGAINTFALDLYWRLASSRGNLFFSPYSVHDALGLAFAGAAGRTAEQMAKVLRWGIDQLDARPSTLVGLGGDARARLVLANAV